MKRVLPLSCILFLLLAVITVASGCVSLVLPDQTNPAEYLTTDEQAVSIASITNIDDGKFYTMNYTADYMLDEILKHDVNSLSDLVSSAGRILTSIPAHNMTIGSGCSAFAATSYDGSVLCGRNFDYTHNMTSVLVKTAPKGGYQSIGIVDAAWLGYTQNTLDDNLTDLSLTLLFPYIFMDGMNEKGVTISVLAVDGGASQQNSGKTNISITLAIRMVLDKAANVDEAIDLLNQYDMEMGLNTGFHLFLADSTGKSCVVEYGNSITSVTNATHVTNFYLVPYMNGEGHGQNRYAIMDAVLKEKEHILSPSDSMALLQLVSQGMKTGSKSETKWSVVYNLTNKTATVANLGNYSNLFTFTMSDISGMANIS